MRISTVWDFVRCQRADGSFYGTGGQCQKGREVSDKVRELVNRTGKLGDRDVDKVSREFPVLGQGKFGKVLDTGGGVVVKIGEIKQQEIDILEELKSVEGVPRVVAENVSKGGNVLAMTKAMGQSGEQREDESEFGPLEVFNGVMPILKQIHAKGIAHTDLHTGNIMYDEETGVTSLIDFGRATRSPSVAIGEAIRLKNDIMEEFSMAKELNPRANVYKQFPQATQFASAVLAYQKGSPDEYRTAESWKLDDKKAMSVLKEIWDRVGG